MPFCVLLTECFKTLHEIVQTFRQHAWSLDMPDVHILSKFNFTINTWRELIEYINSYKYLGIEITCPLCYTKGTATLSDAACKSLGMHSERSSLSIVGNL